MNEDQHTRLVSFLHTELARTEGNQCVRVDLVTPNRGGLRGPFLASWVRKERPDLFEKLQAGSEDIVNEIRQLVIDHVEAHGIDCRFVVTTTQHHGRTQHHQFKVLYNEGAEDHTSPHPEELPRASGLVAQLMRHSDNQSKTLLQIITLTSHANQRMLEELGADNARLRRERGDMYAQVESAQNHRLERELAVQSQAAQEERKDIAMRKLLEILPLLSQKLMSNGTTPTISAQQHDQISIAVNELADMMTPELAQKIASDLDDKHQMAFFKIFQLARAAKAAAEEKTNGEATSPA